MGLLGEGECISNQKAGRDRRLAYPTLPAHFSKEEEEAQRRILLKGCGEPGASPDSWQEFSLDFWAVLENCFNLSGPQFHPLLATVRAAMLLKHLGIICITWPPCLMG